MGKLVIVLADLDERYLQPLEIKFMEEFQDTAEIVVITDRVYLDIFFSKPRHIDIFIINETLYTKALAKHDIENTFILTESYLNSKTDNLNLNRIYKYTSVKEIYSDIIENSKTDTVKHSRKQTGTKVIMVYSPSGGSGKSTVALGLSATLAQKNKKVLYVNTEPFQNFGILLEDSSYMKEKYETAFLRISNLHEIKNECIGEEIFQYVRPLKQSPSDMGMILKTIIIL